MNVKFDLDPTPRKAAAIALCIFFLTFATGVQSIAMQGVTPSMPEFISAFCAATTATAIYLLGFLGYEKSEEG